MFIDINSLDISEGQTIRHDCPRCKGKNTFTATKRNGCIAYNCYKISCDVQGKINLGVSKEELEHYLVTPLIETGNINKRLEHFVYPEHVTTDVSNKYINRFRMRWVGEYANPLENIDLLYDLKDKRAVFPIYNDGLIVDAIGRALDGKQPKWLRYGGAAEYAKYCYGEPNGIYIVVEDVISAVTVAKVYPDVTGFALLGTSLTDAHKECLSDNAAYVMVALDPDALRKTLVMRKEIEAWCDVPTRAIRLRDDVKYQDPEDIEQIGGWIHVAEKSHKQTKPNGEGGKTIKV